MPWDLIILFLEKMINENIVAEDPHWDFRIEHIT